MPMRWTPENDQTLLLKILETSNISVDTKAIANLWPEKNGESKPTPRAITERLVKIRDQCRASGSGGFSVSSSQSKKPRQTGPTPTGVNKNSTPRKPRVKNEGVTPTTAGSNATNSASAIKAEGDDGKPVATTESFRDLPDLIPTSSGTFSNGTSYGDASSQPATPTMAQGSGRKRHVDVLKYENGVGSDAQLYGSDDALELPESPSKRFKAAPNAAASFPGTYGGHYTDVGATMHYAYPRQPMYIEDDAF